MIARIHALRLPVCDIERVKSLNASGVGLSGEALGCFRARALGTCDAAWADAVVSARTDEPTPAKAARRVIPKSVMISRMFWRVRRLVGRLPSLVEAKPTNYRSDEQRSEKAVQGDEGCCEATANEHRDCAIERDGAVPEIDF